MRHTSPQSGFAMLYSVLLVSLILSIAISISNLTLKQAVLSNLAKDSGIAFYQADAATECAMYQDTIISAFPIGATINTGAATDVPEAFMCGETKLFLDPAASQTLAHPEDYFKYTVDSNAVPANKPCFSIIFDKTEPGYSRIQGSGYNLCGDNPRRVERSLEVKLYYQ